ncbi:MAG: hypothetical protein II983_03170 [Firmicutes bacterium]|nr:hypothetical protein [Bacillota bacterium]
MKNRILASALALVLVTGMAVSASAIGSTDVSIAKVYNMPVIDGKYDPAEGWGEPVEVINAGNINDYLSDAAYAGDATLLPESVTSYLRWDEEHLYFCSVVVDSIHYNDNVPEDPGSAWAGDALQYDIKSMADEDTANRNRFFYGLSNDGKLCANMDKVETGATAEGGTNFAWDACVVTRDEATKTTTYETIFDLTQLMPDGSVIEGDQFYVRQIVLCTKDAATEDVVDVNAPGVDAGDYLYWKVTLAGVPEAELVVEEPETEAEVVEEVAAPQTFDAGVIAAVAAVVSLAGFAVSKKH